LYKYIESRFIAVAAGFFYGHLKAPWDPEYASEVKILASL